MPPHPLLSRLRGDLPNESFTFAVIGDNRGGADSMPPAVLFEVIAELNREAPAFVLSTGDLIDAYPEEDEAHLRKLWRGYLAALQQLRVPVFHVPGNHDLFSPLSARLWAEFLGPTYYAFDFGAVRLIGLDTESEPSRVGPEQRAWLRHQLETAGERRIFLSVHQPLFPVDGHIGNSLDKFPADRDALHTLLVAHRDRIEGVFHGHEHLFSLMQRDGIRYYITAGSGSPLYVPREIGGYFHYLLVHVSGRKCEVQLKKISDRTNERQPPRVIQPGEVLETWEQPTIWFLWDQSVVQQRVQEPARDGQGALRLDFNLAHYEWPSLATEFMLPESFSGITRITADVFLLDDVDSDLAVLLGLENHTRIECEPSTLERGWNSISFDLPGAAVLPAKARYKQKLWITFTGDAIDRARSVVVDNVRAWANDATGAGACMFFANWKGPLVWGTWDETTHPASEASLITPGKKALKFHVDLLNYGRPCLYAELRPAWDLSKIPELVLDLFVGKGLQSPVLRLALTGDLETCESPPHRLRVGRNRVRIKLDWLPSRVRCNVRRMEWCVAGGGKGRGWVSFDSMATSRPEADDLT